MLSGTLRADEPECDFDFLPWRLARPWPEQGTFPTCRRLRLTRPPDLGGPNPPTKGVVLRPDRLTPVAENLSFCPSAVAIVVVEPGGRIRVGA